MSYRQYLCLECGDPIYRSNGRWAHRKKDGQKSHAAVRGDCIVRSKRDESLSWVQVSMFGKEAA